MALPINRAAVNALLEQLEPLVLNKAHKGYRCNCGRCSAGRSKAEAIIPGGNSYPGQETLWSLWNVRMKCLERGKSWLCGLNTFVDGEEINEMFIHYFGPRYRQDDNPYKLEFSSQRRMAAGFKSAVRVEETASHRSINFYFDWGVEQSTPANLRRYFNRLITPADTPFNDVVAQLTLLQPSLYRGGPDPELPFESTWLLNYRAAINRARMASAVLFQNIELPPTPKNSVSATEIVFLL